MRKTIVICAALAITLIAGFSFAYECPMDWKKVDAKLAEKPSLSVMDAAAVKELREVGEQLHKDGKHTASVAVLREAMKILGIK